jgi:hypothetical protein
MPRNTSIRRDPIRKDWNKSRAISCGCCTDNYSAKIAILQQSSSSSSFCSCSCSDKKIAAERWIVLSSRRWQTTREPARIISATR